MTMLAPPETTAPEVPDGVTRRGFEAARAIPGVAAIALLVASLWLPLWTATLNAPQYPDGLSMRAYGGRMEGDIREINGLNHYVGMRPFRARDIPELSLWTPTVALGVVAAVVSTITPRRRIGRLARIGVWLIPFGVLADIQFRLYQYGHDLDPEAALRIDPFTPLAVGPTKVWNFTTWALPGLGLAAVAGAAAVLSFGPRAIRALRAKP